MRIVQYNTGAFWFDPELRKLNQPDKCGGYMPELRIYLLGPPRFQLAETPVEIGLRKAVALAVYLALNPRPLGREVLADIFWPQDSARAARGNLRRATYRINRALGLECLLANRDTIQWNPAIQVWIDVNDFRCKATQCGLEDQVPGNPPVSKAEAGCPETLAQAASLYGGDFLAGFTLPDSPAFDEWQFFQGEELRRTYASVLSQLVACHQAQGDWQPALEFAHRWVALDPLEESAHRSLMTIYAATGHYAAALRQFETCRQILATQLQVAPQLQTQALYEMLRTRRGQVHNATNESFSATASLQGQGMDRKHQLEGGQDGITIAARLKAVDNSHSVQMGRPILDPGPPHNLPVSPHPFVGRVAELADIRQLLVEELDCHLLTIIGPGGIGKTRLALEVARRCVRAFPDGVYWVSLAGISSSDNILPAIAEQIGLRFFDGVAARRQLVGYLAKRQMLLVLDNFENLLAGSDLIVEILANAPNLKVLVTSHERLNLRGETVYGIRGMDIPQPGSGKTSGEYSAVQLLVQFARLARPQIELGEREYAAIERICRLVEGMPLALLLAAGWLEVLSFEQIADEIDLNLDILEARFLDVPERQRSVRAAFQYSWDRLSVNDRQAFQRLAVFRGGFTRKAAQQVAGAGLRTLRTLIDKSLVVIREDGRYEIHELLRQYAWVELDASGDAPRIQSRHSRYTLEWLQQLDLDIKGRRQLAALDEIEADLENIRLAWTWAVQSGDEQGMSAAVESLYLFFTLRSRYSEGAQFFYLAYTELNARAEHVGILHRVQARYAWLKSLSSFEPVDLEGQIDECLQTAVAKGDQTEIAFCLMLLGNYQFYIRHDSRRAIHFMEQSLAHYARLEDHFYIVAVLHWLGACFGDAFGPAEAVQYTRRSMELARRYGNQVALPYNLMDLGWAALCLGEYQKAEDTFREALVYGENMGLQMIVGEVKTQLAVLYFLRGEIEQTRTIVADGVEIGREIAFAPTIAVGLAVQSLLATLDGDVQTARRLAEESRTTPGTHFGELLARWALALVELDVQQWQSAERHLRAAFKIARDLNVQAAEIWLLPLVSLLFAGQGDAMAAAELLGLARYHPQSLIGWLVHWKTGGTLERGIQRELGESRFRLFCEAGQRLDAKIVISEWVGEKQTVRTD